MSPTETPSDSDHKKKKKKKEEDPERKKKKKEKKKKKVRVETFCHSLMSFPLFYPSFSNPSLQVGPKTENPEQIAAFLTVLIKAKASS
jgi:hypothetical protein